MDAFVLPVSIEQIDKLIEVLPKETLGKKKTASKIKVDIKQRLLDNGFIIAKEIVGADKTKYILEKCPWNEQHTNMSAFVFQFSNGAITAGCLHDSCAGKNYQDLKPLLFSDDTNDTADTDDTKGAGDDAVKLYSLAMKDIQELFCDQFGNPYIKITVGGMWRVLSVGDKKVKNYLQILFKNNFKYLIKPEALKQVTNQLIAEADFSGVKYPLELRINRDNDILYYDLANDKYEVVKITPNGYEITTDYPILFSRNKNSVQQVYPEMNVTDVADEYWNLLKKHFHFKDDSDRVLFGVYLITSFVSGINHPILILYGEKGSAKSTTATGIKRIVDPSRNELFVIPSSKNDLAISLFNSRMVCFDNLQALTLEKSDMLCMASTGGVISKRMLYSDADEVMLNIHRTVVLNGINVVATQPDLLDRSILVELERIPEADRKTEEKVWKEFNADLPKLLGMVFNTLSKVMALVPNTELQGYSRMADFSLWGYCTAEVLGYDGQSFLEVYKENQCKSNEEAVSANPLAMCVISLMNINPVYDDTVSNLMAKLEWIADMEHLDTKDRSFPKSPNYLSRRLKEIKTNLENMGITFAIRNSGPAKMIKITKS
jgi:hypothetical protein